MPSTHASLYVHLIFSTKDRLIGFADSRKGDCIPIWAVSCA